LISTCLISYLLVSVGIAIGALRHKAGYLHYPFLAALTFCGFAVPQIISLAHSGGYPAHSLEKYIIMASLCVVATHIGFKWGSRAMLIPRVERLFFRKMNARRLRWLSFFYIVVGGLFLVRLYTSGAQFSSQQWEGPSVIYKFLSGFMVYGFVIAADLYLRAGYRKVDMALALLGGMYLLLRAGVHGRRSSAVILFIIILGLLWFRKRKVVPVSLIIAAVAAGLVISASTNAYRAAVADKLEFSRLAGIDFIGKFVESYGEGEAAEVLNGCYVIETTDRTLACDFGASHWNAAVWTFVPRQFVGEKFKRSLMIPINVEENINRVFGYVKNTGTTLTGVADCYLTLFYAGCIKFFWIAFILGVLYTNAERGSAIAIILYVLLLPRGLIAFTHSTLDFSNALIMYSIFLLLGLVLCSSTQRSVVQVVPNSRTRVHV